MQAAQVKYRTEETTIPFQGKTITVRNHTPILPPKERERRKREIERRLYNVLISKVVVYKLEPTVMEGIRTKMMVAEPDAAEHVKLMFEMYADPQTSFGDIARYFSERGISVYGKAQNTWLAGKIKCGRCGYALVSVNSSGIRYLRCHRRVDNIESVRVAVRSEQMSLNNQSVRKW